MSLKIITENNAQGMVVSPKLHLSIANLGEIDSIATALNDAVDTIRQGGGCTKPLIFDMQSIATLDAAALQPLIIAARALQEMGAPKLVLTNMQPNIYPTFEDTPGLSSIFDLWPAATVENTQAQPEVARTAGR